MYHGDVTLEMAGHSRTVSCNRAAYVLVTLSGPAAAGGSADYVSAVMSSCNRISHCNSKQQLSRARFHKVTTT